MCLEVCAEGWREKELLGLLGHQTCMLSKEQEAVCCHPGTAQAAGVVLSTGPRAH